ncbi:hypothetical protein P879_03149 [Paragonimus westermani]|uniref:peptidylprolyl isomerase n=1 Tax=Paragonimus westermani TaxID=34504 RepID=A0A8T0DMS5_9TREM|nr:hypothetical protein P879_03149 [Paragonimus westermani]
MSVLLETSLGVLVIDLYIKERPKCSLNFIKLCQMKYYNFCIFHSVQKNLVAQTGDPTGTGRMGASVFEYVYGDQAKFFDAEKKPKISHTRRGLVSMVDNGHGQHGSQFFFTLADQLEYLDQKHTVFGQVAEGVEFLDHINEVYCDQDSRPFRNVRIHHTIVLDDPFENPKGLRFPDSPTRFPATLFGDLGAPRIEEDEELEEAVGLSPSQLNEYKAEQEAKTHAQLLTLIGDLPDADVKPPDNVLFVCRLNPVTNSEDLEIIFSRFGPIKSCEVIRDRRTNASLQYAFIEFENDSDCENAFLKMDKVVIDDRRIHVDFSQSVSKEWRRYKQQSAFPAALKDSQSSSRQHHGSLRQTEPYHRAHERSNSPPPKRTHHSKPNFHGGHSKRDQSPSACRRLPERFEEQKHKPLPGTDLDLVVSESDEDVSSSSSQSRIRKRKNRRHRHRSRSNDREKSRSVLQFLYEVHQQFDLERNSTETLLHPRDELTCFKLVLKEHEAVFDVDPLTLWPKLCRKRVYRENMDCSELDTLGNEVEDHLNAFNLVDRISLVRRVLVEFQNNLELKETLYNADYLVCSQLLDWFEVYAYSVLNVTYTTAFNSGIVGCVPNAPNPFLILSESRESVFLLEAVHPRLSAAVQKSRMSLDDAFLAVNQCIQAAGRALQKPLIGAINCPTDEEYDAVFTKTKIQEVADALCEKLRRLVSSGAMGLPCGDTPGRPLLHGGSLLGRAAFKLVRFLLVFCDECVEDFGDSDTEGEPTESQVLCSSARMRTPTGHPPVAPRTPTTTGQSDHLFRMLISPQTPLQLNAKLDGGRTEEVENDPQITGQRSPPDLTEAVTMPERPVFSRYQTDLDWSGATQSPLCKRPTLSIRSALSEWNDPECHSMPAWTDSRKLTENANLMECRSVFPF